MRPGRQRPGLIASSRSDLPGVLTPALSRPVALEQTRGSEALVVTVQPPPPVNRPPGSNPRAGGRELVHPYRLSACVSDMTRSVWVVTDCGDGGTAAMNQLFQGAVGYLATSSLAGLAGIGVGIWYWGKNETLCNGVQEGCFKKVVVGGVPFTNSTEFVMLVGAVFAVVFLGITALARRNSAAAS